MNKHLIPIAAAACSSVYLLGLFQDHLIVVGKLADDGMGGHAAPVALASGGISSSVASVAIYIPNPMTGDDMLVPVANPLKLIELALGFDPNPAPEEPEAS